MTYLYIYIYIHIYIYIYIYIYSTHFPLWLLMVKSRVCMRFRHFISSDASSQQVALSESSINKCIKKLVQFAVSQSIFETLIWLIYLWFGLKQCLK